MRRRSFIQGIVGAIGVWPLTTRAQQQKMLPSIPPTGDEFVGPFASWMNVKTAYGVKGDGMADDTAAIQAALNDLGAKGHGTVLYFPAGIYRVTKRLSLANRKFVSIFGEDPASTIIKWAGDSGGTILHIGGVAHSRFDRLTFDGSATAAIAVDQSSDGGPGFFDTGNEYGDDTFKNAGIGIRGGALKGGFAETTILRSHFSNISLAGIFLGNFNALDLWVHNSTFTDCNIGVTNWLPNANGAGNYHVYNSIFSRSKTADFGIGNTGGFSMRNNYSIGSRRFIQAGGTNNPAFMSIQGNTILDTTDSYSISIGNQGPVLLYDNVIRSLSRGQWGVVFIAAFSANSDGFAIGNTFTEHTPIGVNNRLTEIDSSIVAASSLNPSIPTLLETQPNFHRPVIDVPAGAGATTIQQAINTAIAKYNGNRPVVHLPAGTYKITIPIIIPANADLQLVGDGCMTELLWAGSGTGPVLRIQGPSKARIVELKVNGSKAAEGIVANDIDQPGSRIFMEGVDLSGGTKTNLYVDGLEYAQLDASDIGHAFQKTGIGIKVVGGPLAAAGNPQTAHVNIYSGSSAGEVLPYDISNGARVLLRDYWYESSPSPLYLRVTGRATVTMDNCNVALETSTAPAYDISNLIGKVSIIGNGTHGRIVVSGDGTNAQVLDLGEVSEISSPYFFNSASPSATTGLLNSREVTKTVPGSRTIQTPNQGTTNSAFIRSMLAQTRAAVRQPLTALPHGVTDLRFERVWGIDCTNNIHLMSSGPTTSPPTLPASRKR